ncbi:MAG: hypothetical protein BroJett011_22720 [Chloroflexota bacterium]|nr:MAG: hypothetical protein BroJett011_22720 [Chloroflexota bacterium]
MGPITQNITYRCIYDEKNNIAWFIFYPAFPVKRLWRCVERGDGGLVYANHCPPASGCGDTGYAGSNANPVPFARPNLGAGDAWPRPGFPDGNSYGCNFNERHYPVGSGNRRRNGGSQHLPHGSMGFYLWHNVTHPARFTG